MGPQKRTAHCRPRSNWHPQSSALTAGKRESSRTKCCAAGPSWSTLRSTLKLPIGARYGIKGRPRPHGSSVIIATTDQCQDLRLTAFAKYWRTCPVQSPDLRRKRRCWGSRQDARPPDEAVRDACQSRIPTFRCDLAERQSLRARRGDPQ